MTSDRGDKLRGDNKLRAENKAHAFVNILAGFAIKELVNSVGPTPKDTPKRAMTLTAKYDLLINNREVLYQLALRRAGGDQS